jgi:hypothetical protein
MKKGKKLKNSKKKSAQKNTMKRSAVSKSKQDQSAVTAKAKKPDGGGSSLMSWYSSKNEK